ncbi:tetratricopeptide repeat protein [Saccharopolyspora gregorii]|uniref:AfsR-like transcriptional regulator TcrA n=1 Tax=Saccharopolyspora gregorii TaxID=33914 RepID=A0ABP6RKM4_9PSEU
MTGDRAHDGSAGQGARRTAAQEIRTSNAVHRNDGLVVQAGQINGDVHFAAPVPPPRPLASTLPRAPARLVGREAELDAVLGAGNPVRLLTGMGGCGKSALAIAAADRLRGEHPGGVVLLPCRGYRDRGEFGLREAVAELLALLEVPAAHAVGVGLLHRRFAEFAAAGLPLLLVLDDVGPHWDVAALLPSDPVHGVLITSRDELDVDAEPVRLGALPAGSAVELLRREIARGDPADPRARLREDLLLVAERCGYLPLALRVVGELLRGDPRREPRVVAADLGSPHRLSVLEKVRSAVALSAAALRESPNRVDRSAAALFERLGLLPGVEFTAARAAVLLDEPDPRFARLLLDRLCAAHLLEPRADGGAFHDLTGECAAESFAALPARLRRSLALRFAEHCADVADAAVAPLRPGADATSEQVGAGLRTLHDEHDALLAGLTDAVARGTAGADAERLCAAAARVAEALLVRCERTGRVHEARRAAEPLLLASRVLGDQDAELRALLALCEAHLAGGRPGEAAGYVRQAIELTRARYADPRFPATFSRTMATYARLAAETGEHEVAAAEYRRLLDRHRRDEDAPGRCAALGGLGRAALLRGDLDEAARRYEAARALADRHGLAEQAEIAWNALGVVLARRGEVDGAADCHRAARDSAERHGFPHRAAIAVHHLADLRLAGGDAEGARQHYERCARLYREAGDHRRAEELADRLAALPDEPPDLPAEPPPSPRFPADPAPAARPQPPLFPVVVPPALVLAQVALVWSGHGSAALWAWWAVAVPMAVLVAVRDRVAVALPFALWWPDVAMVGAVLGYSLTAVPAGHLAFVAAGMLVVCALALLRSLRSRSSTSGRRRGR